MNEVLNTNSNYKTVLRISKILSSEVENLGLLKDMTKH